MFITSFNGYCQFKLNISVTDSITSEPVNNCIIISPNSNSSTNYYGYATLTESGNINLSFYKEGYCNLNKNFEITKDTIIEVKLSSCILDEVEITSKRNSNSLVYEINSSELKSLPLPLGEKDILRALQTLPGVLSDGENANNLIVQGGGSDQNQYIMDDIVVYNTNHLLGLVSTVNPDIVTSVTSYASVFPARYGGKLSSVNDIRIMNGNPKKISGGFSISPVSTKFNLNGPIKKDKATFLIAGRRTFWDPLAKSIFEDFSDYPSFNFYDINAKFTCEINNRNRLYINGLRNSDKFSESGTNSNSIGWKSEGGSIRWNQLFKTIFLNYSFVYSDYKFQSLTNSDTYSITYKSAIRSLAIKTDADIYINNIYSIKSGFSFENELLKPGTSATVLSTSQINNFQSYNCNDASVYLENHITTGKFNINAGIRTSIFDSDKNYFKLSPGLILEYYFNNKITFNINCGKTYQFLHQLTNTSPGLPSDLWVPSLSNVEPQSAQSAQIGSNINLKKITITSSIYYRQLENIISYKPGSKFLKISQDPLKSVIPDWKENVVQGKGESYGATVYSKMTLKKFQLAATYTLSYCKRKFDEINLGEWVYAAFDRRHNANLQLTWDIRQRDNNKRLTQLALSFYFASANPVTYPIGISYSNPATGSDLEIATTTLFLTERIRSSHRADLSIKWVRIKNKKSIFEVGVYNLYNRKNPFYYFLENNSLKFKTYFPILPYISYEINF